MSLPAKAAQLVFFDSTDLHWCPDVGFSYTVMAEQIKVDSPGRENPWCALFGSIIYPTGEGLYTIHERKRHQEVEAHLKVLIQEHPETFWFVVMDNASAHTTPMLDDFWAVNQEKIQPVYQPTYSPHLNLIEKLWRLMRGQMTKNYFYPTLIHLCEAVINWLEKLPFSQFCSLMGIDESTLEFV
ncbi:IS630 family transposase [bacterium]|nr:IS630 family transposase [bacterium]